MEEKNNKLKIDDIIITYVKYHFFQCQIEDKFHQ